MKTTWRELCGLLEVPGGHRVPAVSMNMVSRVGAGCSLETWHRTPGQGKGLCQLFLCDVPSSAILSSYPFPGQTAVTRDSRKGTTVQLGASSAGENVFTHRMWRVAPRTWAAGACACTPCLGASLCPGAHSSGQEAPEMLSVLSWACLPSPECPAAGHTASGSGTARLPPQAESESKGTCTARAAPHTAAARPLHLPLGWGS